MLLHMSPSLVIKLLTIDSQTKRTDLLFNWLKTLSMTTLSKRKTHLNSDLLADIDFKLRVLFLSNVKIIDINSAFDLMANTFD